MAAQKLDINVQRLLRQCEAMASDYRDEKPNMKWRLEKVGKPLVFSIIKVVIHMKRGDFPNIQYDNDVFTNKLNTLTMTCTVSVFLSRNRTSCLQLLKKISGKISVLGCTIVKSYELNLTQTLASIVKYAMKLHA